MDVISQLVLWATMTLSTTACTPANAQHEPQSPEEV
jgi:hypothetical protein